MDPEQQTRLQALVAGALVLIVVGGTIDLVLDDPESWYSFHVLFELGMIVAALVLATSLGLGWLSAEQSAHQLRKDLSTGNSERDAWRARAKGVLEGLGVVVREQMRTWDLTGAERDVALLMLKGHSHKAIANATGRSPQTVRQHASAVYAKSGLGGRAELSAFFLDELMLPDEEEGVLEPEG